MKRFKKSWMAVVVAAILVGTLAGVVWARPKDRPEAQDITRKVTLTGADLIPAADELDWQNQGGSLELSSSTIGGLHAPVVFPCLSSVVVERIKLHAYDNNGGLVAGACATLYRAKPDTKSDQELASACSPSEPGGTSADPETFTSTDIDQQVWPSQKAYILITIIGENVKVYGVTIEYHRNV